MAERSDEIRDQIDAQRGALGENLHELERRVKDTTDWRAHMDRHPWVMLGLAFGTGVAVSGILSRSTSGYGSSSYSEPPAYSSAASYETPTSSRFTNFREQKSRAAEALDKMTGALIAVGVQKLQDLLGETIPGFRDKFEPQQGSQARSSESYPGGYNANRADEYEPASTPTI